MALFATIVPVFAQSAAIRRLGAGRTTLYSMIGAALVVLGVLSVSRR